MQDTPDIEIAAPPSLEKSPGPFRRAGERALVWLHRQAERLDLVPAEFGNAGSVDTGDAKSLVGEWLRQARLWADYSPEQVLALKVGALVLGLALVGLVLLVGVIR